MSDTLVIEFDYAQNAALPKLSVCEQFYKRLIWMYIFNVYVHNSNESFMYSMIEGQASKNPDSVISFIFDALQKILIAYPSRYRRVIFFSDAAGSQNKNSSMVKFCLWCSRFFNIEIVHIFPERGHSFCQCDRNFSYFRQKTKCKERIVSVREYLSCL